MIIGIIDDEEMECCFEILGRNNEILFLIIFMNLRILFICVCYEFVGNMIEKIIVICGSLMDVSGWVEVLGKD